jgi:fructosamine-3-kinase
VIDAVLHVHVGGRRRVQALGASGLAYQEAAPVAPGYARRRAAYQLVHLLNHARLFAGSDLRQMMAGAEAVLRRG